MIPPASLVIDSARIGTEGISTSFGGAFPGVLFPSAFFGGGFQALARVTCLARRRRSGCARSAARSSAAPPKRRAPPTDRTCTRRAAHLQNTAREQLLINTLHAGAQVFEYVRQHRTRASSTRASRVRAPRCARAAQPLFTSHCCCLLRRSTCLCVREGRHCCCRRTLRPAHSAHRVAPRSLIRHARR